MEYDYRALAQYASSNIMKFRSFDYSTAVGQKILFILIAYYQAESMLVCQEW